MSDEEGHSSTQQTVVFNPTFVGQMEEYSPTTDWKQYVERLELFFEVNNVPSAKKVPSILTLMGSKMYALLRSIVAPRRPKELTFKEVIDTLGQHLEPKPIVIAERYKFHKTEQTESESIRDYLAKLQKLAETCEFGGYREEAICDRFVCGLRSRSIQRKLLGEVELTLQTAVEKACAAELTERETSVLHGDAINRTEIKLECFRCGKNNHVPDSCFYRKAKCHGCQKYGHILKKCPTRVDNKRNPKPFSGKTKGKGDKKKKRPSGINQVEMDQTKEEVDKTVWPMFTISNSSEPCKELTVLVSVDGKPLKMEVDTGASLTVIPNNVWKEVLASKPLRDTKVKLKSYSGHEIPVKGEVDVRVVYGNQEAHLPMIVTESEGPVLLGRNWLAVLRLNWNQIKKVIKDPNSQLEELHAKYSSLFDETLGTVKGVTAHLHIKPNSTPRFYKPRPVPFALKDKIAEELERLEKLGVVEKVECSDWATPIVPVLKPDGSVRICGDYKVTINPCLEVPEYPMPTAEERFTRLNCGEKFSKLDLSSAYQQVILDEESRQYVTINTHMGGCIDIPDYLLEWPQVQLYSRRPWMWL